MESAPSSNTQTSVPQPQRQPLPRWVIPLIILLAVSWTCVYITGLAGSLLLWAQFSGVTFAQAAPAGWTNISLRGTSSGMQYAISQDDPGVILACGDSLNGYQDMTACWRTTDGGSHWQTLRAAPFEAAPAYQLAAPRDAGATFFAVEDNGIGSSAVDSVWVTHDAGLSWRRVTTQTFDSTGISNEVDVLSNAIYRDGRLYALLYPTTIQDIIPKTFVVSLNDGATWTPTEQRPSALEQQGWGANSFAADYRAPHSWFRTMIPEGPGEFLEHSSDDGRTWQTVSRMATTESAALAGLGEDSLATTPLRPNVVCATGYDLGMVASADGGRSWRNGTPTIDVSAWRGYQPSPVRIGSNGTCYAAFNYQVQPAAPIHSLQLSNAPFFYVILQFPSGENTISKVPLASSYSGDVGSNDDDSFAYVPAGRGMSARLVLHAFNSAPPWLSDNDESLIWRAVP